VASGTLYFNSIRSSAPGIYRAAANGSGPVELVVSTPQGVANGLHYDPVGHRFYSTYTSPVGSEIRSVNLDGTDPILIAQYISTLYWMEAAHGTEGQPPVLTVQRTS